MSSPRLSLRVLCLGLSVLGLACGSTSPDGELPSDGGARPDGGSIVVVPGAVSLRVEAAAEQSSVADLSAATGKTFAVVRLSLSNGLTSAVTVNPMNFRLGTGDGLEVVASAASLQLPGACPSDAFLAALRSISCSVAFEIGRSVEPSSLLYVGTADGQTDAGSLRAEAAITSFERCSRCGGACVDLKTSTEHCGACHTGVPEGGLCVDGEPSCAEGFSVCGVTCVDLKSDEDHCGACFVQDCYLCADGVPTCDPGKSCVEDGCVDAFTEAMLRVSTTRISCDALCDREGLECRQMVAWQGDGIDRPLVVYQPSDGPPFASPDLDCSQVPPAVPGAQFLEIRCACAMAMP